MFNVIAVNSKDQIMIFIYVLFANYHFIFIFPSEKL